MVPVESSPARPSLRAYSSVAISTEYLLQNPTRSCVNVFHALLAEILDLLEKGLFHHQCAQSQMDRYGCVSTQ